MAQKLMCW